MLLHRALFGILLTLALPACLGGALTTGREGKDTGGDSGGWIAAGGRGPGGVPGTGGLVGGDGGVRYGAGGAPAAICMVQNPAHRSDPPEIPAEIDVAWCNATHTCATCGWRFFGVGIYVAGQPDANCTLPSFICPAIPGSTAADAGFPVCPADTDAGASDHATIDFDGYSQAPTDCTISRWADAGSETNISSCQLGGFTCAISCAACP